LNAMAKRRAGARARTRVRLRKNDLVEVISGRDAGKRGKVLAVLAAEGRVLVQGVNFIKRHTRPNPQRNIRGGIVEREAPIHTSNVMIVSPDDDKPTRIGFKLLADGRKVRIGRRGGEGLDK
jgi:large subunit ribosomal protein L24